MRQKVQPPCQQNSSSEARSRFRKLSEITLTYWLAQDCSYIWLGSDRLNVDMSRFALSQWRKRLRRDR